MAKELEVNTEMLESPWGRWASTSCDNKEVPQGLLLPRNEEQNEKHCNFPDNCGQFLLPSPQLSHFQVVSQVAGGAGDVGSSC